MSPHENDRALLYIRVSTAKQADHGHSLDAQRTRLLAYAKKRRLKVVDVIVDEGESAGTLNRPGLRRALEMVEAGDADVLVATKGDRVFRSLQDQCNVVDRLRAIGGEIALSEEDFDMSTPDGRLLVNVRGSVAQYERELASQRTREGMAAAKAKGVRIGRPPFGYMIEDGQVVPDPSKADELARRRDVAARIQSMQEAGESLRSIAATLTSEGVPTATGKGEWTAAAVKRAAVVAEPV